MELVVHGALTDGTTIERSECLMLVPPATPPGLLTVSAGDTDGWIEVQPLDLQLDGGGFGTFERGYPQGAVVTLTAAPQLPDGRLFRAWRVNGVRQAAGVMSIDVTIAEDSTTATAIYKRAAAVQPSGGNYQGQTTTGDPLPLPNP